MSVPQIVKDLQTRIIFVDFRDVSKHHQYIGARCLAAPMHWCFIKAIEMLAAHCLFGRQLPNQSAEAKRKRK